MPVTICRVQGMLYRSSRLWKQGSSPSEVVRGGVSPFCPEEILAVDFGDYRIARGEKGKPFIVGVENVFFNISHSGDYVVCSVSDREIGIDIEKRAKLEWKWPDVFSTKKRWLY